MGIRMHMLTDLSLVLQVQGLQLSLTEAQQTAQGLQASLQQKAADYLARTQTAEAAHSEAASSQAADLQAAEQRCASVQSQLAQAEADLALACQQLGSSAQALQAAQQEVQAQRAVGHDLDQRLAHSTQQAVEASAAQAAQVQLLSASLFTMYTHTGGRSCRCACAMSE